MRSPTLLLLLLASVECNIFLKYYPDTTIERMPITLRNRPWSKSLPNYYPPTFSKACLANEKCDEMAAVLKYRYNKNMDGVDRRSNAVFFKYDLDAHNSPLNPLGRTGIRGRGSFPRFGPNHEIVYVITRIADPFDYAILNTTLKNTGDVEAFPFMKTDQPTDFKLPPELVRLIRHELRNYPNETIHDILKRTIKKRKLIYKGYYHCQLNTDNAWKEIWVYELRDEYMNGLGLMDLKEPNELNLIWQTANEEKFNEHMQSVVDFTVLNFGQKLGFKMLEKWRSMTDIGLKAFLFSTGVDTVSSAITIAGIAVSLA